MKGWLCIKNFSPLGPIEQKLRAKEVGRNDCDRHVDGDRLSTNQIAPKALRCFRYIKKKKTEIEKHKPFHYSKL